MTAAEFERLAAKTRLKAGGRSLEAARRLLVEGGRAVVVGRDLGISGTAARAARDRILRELRDEQRIPADWVAVTVFVPPDRVEAVRKLAEGD